MGTNFYLRRKLPLDRKKLNQLINDYDFDEAIDILTELKKDSVIHIGKRSGGWKFLWDAHDFRYFEPSESSLKEFLKSGQITDEYGESFTYDQFWEEELKGFLDGDLLDGEKYDKLHGRSSYRSYGVRKDFYGKHGIEINESDEFYIGKYRFTIHEDFS